MTNIKQKKKKRSKSSPGRYKTCTLWFEMKRAVQFVQECGKYSPGSLQKFRILNLFIDDMKH